MAGLLERYEAARAAAADGIPGPTAPVDDRSNISRGFSAGIDQTQALAFGALSAAGDLLDRGGMSGGAALAEYGIEGYQRNMDEAAESAPDVAQFSDIRSGSDAAAWAMYEIGRAVPTLATVIGTGGAVGAAGQVAARKAASAALKSQIERRAAGLVATGLSEKAALKGATEAVTRSAVKAGGIAGFTAPNVGLATGGIMGQVEQETSQLEGPTALAFGTVSGMLDTVPLLNIARRAGISSDAVKQGVWSKISKDALKGIRDEGATEFVQTLVEAAAVDYVQDNLGAFTLEDLKEAANAAAAGGLIGGLLGGAGGAASSFRGGVDPSADAAGEIAAIEAELDDVKDVERAESLKTRAEETTSALAERLEAEARERIANGDQGAYVQAQSEIAKLYERLGSIRTRTKGVAEEATIAESTVDTSNPDIDVGEPARQVEGDLVEPGTDAVPQRTRVPIGKGITIDGESVVVAGDGKPWKNERAATRQLKGPIAKTHEVKPDANGFLLAPKPTAELTLDAKANEAATSPTNDLPEPTEAQKQAGNYRVGKVKLDGLNISIENPKGSQRKGVDPSGKPWSVKMKSHYGYVKGSEAVDGDAVDVFLSDDAENTSLPVYIIDQVDESGAYDEPKVMIGYGSQAKAEAAYLSNYAKGWTGLGGITPMAMADFKKWVKSDAAREPVSRILKDQAAETDDARRGNDDGTGGGQSEAGGYSRAPVAGEERSRVEDTDRGAPEIRADDVSRAQEGGEDAGNAPSQRRAAGSPANDGGQSQRRGERAPDLRADDPGAGDSSDGLSGRGVGDGDVSPSVQDAGAVAANESGSSTAGQAGTNDQRVATEPAGRGGEQRGSGESAGPVFVDETGGRDDGLESSAERTGRQAQDARDSSNDAQNGRDSEARSRAGKGSVRKPGKKAKTTAKKPKTTAKQRAAKRRIVNPQVDDILTAVSKLGGIATDVETVLKGRLSHIKTPVGMPNLERPEERGGRLLDDISEQLMELGYVSSTGVGNGVDQAKVLDLLERAAVGEKIYSVNANDDILREQVYGDLLDEFPGGADEYIKADGAGTSQAEAEYPANAEPVDRTLADLMEDVEAFGVSRESVEATVEAMAMAGDDSRTIMGELFALAEEEQDGQTAEPGRTESARAPEEPLLENYTNDEIRERERTSRKAEADQREADSRAEQQGTADDFTLTGSSRSADEASARGQGDLLDEPVAPAKPEKPAASKRKRQTKETQDGLAMFAKPVDDETASRPKGVPKGAIEKIVKRISRSWPGAPRIEVVETLGDVPAEGQNLADDGAIRGVYLNESKTVYLVADAMPSAIAVEETLLHEAQHYANRAAFGREAVQKLEALGKVVRDQHGSIKAYVEARGIDYDYDWYDQQFTGAGLNRQQADAKHVDELLAHMAGESAKTGGRIRRAARSAIAAIRQWLRSKGFKLASSLPDDALVDMLNRTQKVLTGKTDAAVRPIRSRASGAEAMFSRPDDNKGSVQQDVEMEAITLYHGSHENALPEIQAEDRIGNLFDGLFFSGSKNAAASHGSGEPFAIEMPESSIASTADLASADVETVRSLLAEESGESSSSIIDDLYEAVINEGNTESLEGRIDTRSTSGELGADTSWEVQRLRGRVAKALGFKAVEMDDEHGTSYLVVEMPKQAQGDGVEAMFSRPLKSSLAQAPDHLNPWGTSTATENLRRLKGVAMRKFADRHDILKRTQDTLRANGADIPESQDAYMAETQLHGKAELDLDQMESSYVKPLAKKLAEFDITQAQLDEYLVAMHAQERNEYIASINPEMQDGGSGMTTAEAAKIKADIAAGGKLGYYQQLGQIVSDMVESQRQILEDHGLTDPNEVDGWRKQYKHYVPLKGFADDEPGSGRPRTGSGLSIGGKETKSATGRGAGNTSASPSTQAIGDLAEKLVRRRKNDVGNAFLDLVQANPDPDFWEVFTNANPEMSSTRVLAEKGDPETGRPDRYEVRETPIPMAMMSDRYFTTKKNGETYYIKLADERLLNSMNNVGPESHGALVRTLSAVTRFLSAVNTSYNPEFVVTNALRDIQTAVLNLSAEQTRDDGKIIGEAIVKQTAKDIPKAMRGAWAGLRDKSGTTGAVAEWQRYFQEFREDGGKVGNFSSKDLGTQMADIDKLVRMAKGGARGKAESFFQQSTEFVEDMNGAVENAIRLSAYKNARDAGISRAKAAVLAKDMTVNFNRRGEAGTLLNALYMFTNASIQGTRNLARTLYGLNGDGSLRWRNMNNAQKAMVGLMGGSFALAMANRYGSEEDDDGKLFYDKIPGYIKERNIVLMKSLFGGPADEYWTIPLPYGFNVGPVIGTGLEAVVSGAKSPGAAAGDLALAVAGSFSPIGYSDSESLSGLLLKNATPTIMKPIVDMSMNENFFGGTIRTENFPFGAQKPESSLGRRGTAEGYKALARFLNDSTGGSQFRPGAIDVSPENMAYLVDFALGASGSFWLDKAPDFVIKSATRTEVDPQKVPFLGKLNGKVMPYEDRNEFYSHRDEIEQIRSEAEALSGSQLRAFKKEYGSRLALRPKMKAAEKKLKGLRERRDLIYAQTLGMREESQRLDLVNRQMKKVIDEFARDWSAAAP